jgi:lipopolysaccharide transport system permease protein
MAFTTSEKTSELEQAASATVSQTSHHQPPPLPDKPLVVIEPQASLVGLRLGDLWSYRELLYFLSWRDIKVRYKQTALGVAWAILQPLLTMIVFTIFFGKFAGVPSDNIPYPLFAYAGLLPWTFLSNGVTNSGNSLVGSSHLITKVYFPRMLVPASAITAGLADFLMAFVVLVLLMIYYGIAISPGILLLPVLVLLTTLLALGVGMWLSALNVKYRDVRFALPFLIQLWMYITPVIYPVSFIPERWWPLRYLLLINPMTGIVENFRASLFGQQIKWIPLLISTVITMAMLVFAAYAFRRMERTFADIV